MKRAAARVAPLARGHDPHCTRCSRLTRLLRGVRAEHPAYHAGPVPSFGVSEPTLLVVGLAPGLHGANRTGRPFTGDYAGILLYETLYQFEFSSAPTSVAVGDGLRLHECRIANAVKCLPPANKPTAAEIRQCNPYLAGELARVPLGGVILALGRIAHGAVLKAMGAKASSYPFSHGAEHCLEGERWLLDSYHCSRYNTQTRRLTPSMFSAVFARARGLLASRAE